MDFITKYRRQVAIRTFIGAIIPLLLSAITWYFIQEILGLSVELSVIISLSVGFISVLLSNNFVVSSVSSPVSALENIISYAAHSERSDHQPSIESLKVGRELVTAQSLLIYDLASSIKSVPTDVDGANPQVNSLTESSSTLIDSIPVPIIGLDSNHNITNANKSAGDYLSKSVDTIIGRPIDDVMPLSFQEDETLEVWLNNAKTSSVISTKSWERVRYTVDQETHKQFDMSASFSSGNQSGTESVLAIFDHTSKYNQDDQDIGFVALAVHELRTPLTIMRGYIEVFEEELEDSLTPELLDFMHKMHASSERLTSFVNNILNVARIEENLLTLKLKSENWQEILESATDDLKLRAGVYGINLDISIDGTIPPVAVDRISIHEVLNNLIDNAIKYSGKSTSIVIRSSVNSEGMIETSIQDFGIGIPESVIKQLFQKYHRSHRSSTQISGTGLGLYLCKSLIAAHGGNIWVRSKEGEGSIFSFTILPFDQISKEQANGEDGIIRGAHGWIKNHSLYRN